MSVLLTSAGRAQDDIDSKASDGAVPTLPASIYGLAVKGSAVGKATFGAQAQAEFKKRDFDRAIVLFQRHLRANKQDANAWTQLAASYYHTGLPRRALKYLKQVEKRASDRSFNFLYQGLCLDATGNRDEARKYLQWASQSTDEYGMRAIYELAVIEYIARNKDKSLAWLGQLVQRYPNGSLKAKAADLARSLQNVGQGLDPNAAWLDDKIARSGAVERPDTEKALYRYNAYSLTNSPHYWFAQTGLNYIDETGQQPTDRGGLTTRSTSLQGLLFSLGGGVGPWRNGQLSAWAGYNYRQTWLTDDDRLNTYLDDPGDISYFPYRSDLLLRKHQLYLDFRRTSLSEFIYAGVFTRLELLRIGSSLIPGPEDSDLQTVSKISDATLMIPWIGLNFSSTQKSLFYLYFRKEINPDSPDLSNKTYDLAGSPPAISLGLNHNIDVPEYKLNFDAEIFRYENIYNDFWLDYTRQGFLAAANMEFLPRVYVNLLVGAYRDSYIVPQIKQGSCSRKPGTVESGAGSSSTTDEIKQCYRNDAGLMLKAGLYWSYSQFMRLAGNYAMITNSNSAQQEFERQQNVMEVTFTWAFPSVKRVERFVERFGDNAFTKEAE